MQEQNQTQKNLPVTKTNLSDVLTGLDSTMELIVKERDDLTKGLKGLKKNSESKKSLDLLKSNLSKLKEGFDELNCLSEDQIKESTNFEKLKIWLRDARTLRKSLEDERTGYNSEIKKLSDKINDFYKSPKIIIEEWEDLIKPIRRKIEQAEEDEKNRKKAEALARTTQRIDELIRLGAKLEDGYYIITDPEDSTNSVQVQGTDINNTSDELWEQVTKLANEINTKIKLKEEADAKRKKDEEEKLEADKKRLAEETERVQAERYSNRKEVVYSIGLTESGDNFIYKDDVVLTVRDLKELEYDKWNVRLSEAKAQIQKINLLELVRANTQKILSNRFNLDTVNKIYYFKLPDENEPDRIEISMDDLADTVKVDRVIEECKKMSSDYSDKLEKIKAVIDVRSGILDKYGFVYIVSSKVWKRTFTGWADDIIITYKELYEMDEATLNNKTTEFAKLISDYNKHVTEQHEANERAKRIHEEEERKKREKEDIQKQNDNDKINSLKMELSKVFSKYVFTNTDTNSKFVKIAEELSFKINSLIK